ncbi:MAG: AAA family ATPase [Chloroflexi bacterium]|nr:AAA family ATPase [Chloroflexota bacterium]
MSRNIQILLVDEDAKSRTGLRRQLALADFAVLGESGYGQEAFTLAKELGPDIIVMSMEEPVARALRTAEALNLSLPETPIVIISSLGGREYLRKAMLAGAREYIIEPFRTEELRQALGSVLQLQEKRKISQVTSEVEAAQYGSVITLYGAKGGIGKTTLSINLAVAMATTTDQKVALVDLDMEFGSAAVMMDIIPQKTIYDLIQIGEEIDEDGVRSCLTIHPSGVALLAAPMRPDEAEAVTPQHVTKVLEMLSRSYDYVFVDTNPSLDGRAAAALEMSVLILLVSSLEIACIKNTKLFLEMTKAWQFASEKVKLIINSANSANTLQKKDIEDTLSYPVFWQIPHDLDVAAAAQMGKPLILTSPKSKAAQNITELIYVLGGGTHPSKKGKGLLGHFSRNS